MKDTGIHKPFQMPTLIKPQSEQKLITRNSRENLGIDRSSYRDTDKIQKTLQASQVRANTPIQKLPLNITQQGPQEESSFTAEDSNPSSTSQICNKITPQEAETLSIPPTSTLHNPLPEAANSTPSAQVHSFKKPFSFLSVKLATKQAEKDPTDIHKHFKVLLTRKSTKKHKTYEDGVLVINLKKSTLFDIEGKKLLDRPSSLDLRELQVGEQITMGLYEIEVDSLISKEDYISGKCFLEQLTGITTKPTASGIKQATPKSLTIPDNSFVLDLAKGIYIEEFLNEKLRSHQQEGISFMYECIMGYKGPGINGCILADSMGLGKTLQSIALLYTLSRKNASYEPPVRKAVIVAPSSLVNNWKQEIYKWLGPIRIQPIACVGNRKEVENSMNLFIKG
jgi:SNF2 family DNA or RNA helicase